MYRHLFYFVFVWIAAPMDIVLNVVFGLENNRPEYYLKPLADGAFYVYAFTLSVETLLRLFSNRKIFDNRKHLQALVVASAIVILIFIMQYMNFTLPAVRAGTATTSEGSIIVQLATVFVALFATHISYHICERDNRDQDAAKA